MAVHETDILIIGGGITSAMLAQKLSELRPGRQDHGGRAGRRSSTHRTAALTAERAMEYGEHPWHDDYIEDQQATASSR